MGRTSITMGIQDALENARAARAVDRVYEAVHTDQAYPVVAPSHIMCTEEVPGVGGMSTRISERMPLNHMEAGCTIRSDWEGTKLRRRAYASGVVHPRELEAEMVHDHPGAASHHYHGCAPHSTRDSILFSRDQGALMQEEMYYARERGHMRAMDRPAVEALPAPWVSSWFHWRTSSTRLWRTPWLWRTRISFGVQPCWHGASWHGRSIRLRPWHGTSSAWIWIWTSWHGTPWFRWQRPSLRSAIRRSGSRGLRSGSSNQISELSLFIKFSVVVKKK